MSPDTLEKARDLKAQGLTYREIADQLGVSVSAVFRALSGESPPSAPTVALPPENTPSEEAASAALPAPTVEPPHSSSDHAASGMLDGRIATARARLVAIAEERALLPQQKQAALSMPDLDQAALDALDDREWALKIESDRLTQHVSLLLAQAENAHADEAQQRLNSMPAEVARISEAYPSALQDYNRAIEDLMKAAATLCELQGGQREIALERAYLMERFRLTAPKISELPEPPHPNEASQAVGRAFSPFHDLPHASQWRRKQVKVSEERNQAKRVLQYEAAA